MYLLDKNNRKNDKQSRIIKDKTIKYRNFKSINVKELQHSPENTRYRKRAVGYCISIR